MNVNKKEKVAFYPTPEIIVKEMIKISGAKIDDKILDSGYGAGAFIGELLREGYENVYGVEYSTDFYEQSLSVFGGATLVHADFLSYGEDGFDSIIGNPPYIKADNLEASVRENILNLTGSGEGNIYYAFILKSIELLKTGGSLTYILPYDFFYNTHGKKLREEMVKDGYFAEIVDFGESRLFKNAAPETIIFKWIKDKNIPQADKPKIKVKVVKKTLNVADLQEDDIYKDFKSFEQNNFQDGTTWFLSETEKLKGTFLKDVKGVKISVGIVNGAEYAFALDDEEYSLLSLKEQQDYVREFIKNRSRDKNEFCQKSETYIWIPTNEFEDEDELKKKAPGIYSHLQKHREKLDKRQLSKTKAYYDYLAIRNLSTFDKNKDKIKLHVPSLSRAEKNWFFKSKNDCLVAGDLLTITSDDQDLIARIYNYLNGEAFVKYYKQTGAKKGKRVVFTQKALSEVVIPEDIILG